MDPQWIEIASKFGVPVVILVAVWWGGGKILRWVGKEIILPVRDGIIVTVSEVGKRAIKYLDDNLLWMRALGQRMDQMAESQTRHHAWEELLLEDMQGKIVEIGRTKGFDWARPERLEPENGIKSNPKKTMKP